MFGAYVTRAVEQLERARVAAARAREAIEARNGFRVVIQDVRARIEHGVKRRFVALKIRNEHFDADRRHALADFANRVRKNLRAAILHIVAIDRRHDDVRQLQLLDGFGHARRLRFVHGVRPAMSHGAVAARAGADVAQNHERGGAVRPAFADVRAARFLAHRVQLELAHQAFEAEVGRRAGRAHLEPLGLRLAGRHRR